MADSLDLTPGELDISILGGDSATFTMTTDLAEGLDTWVGVVEGDDETFDLEVTATEDPAGTYEITVVVPLPDVDDNPQLPAGTYRYYVRGTSDTDRATVLYGAWTVRE